jgi:glutamate/tyrosine decarboxylase-like PLP-dependent enzyme
MGAAGAIADHVADHPDLAVVSDPDMSLLAIESTAADLNAWTVQRELSENGWELERQKRPESMHLSAMAQHAPIVEEFLSDLEAAVETARAAETEEADAPLYGLSGSLDEDDDVTEALVDMLNEVFV